MITIISVQLKQMYLLPDPADKNKLVKAAVWPEVIYRDEWDDMIKDLYF